MKFELNYRITHKCLKKFVQTTNFEEITDKLDSNKIFSEIKLKTIKWHGDESLTHYLSDELIVGYRPTF